MTRQRLLSCAVAAPPDVALVRQRCRQVAQLLGYDPQDQTRLSTAVSEIARNACEHAGGGTVAFFAQAPPACPLEIEVADRGPGIAAAAARAGDGMGLVGARRLMDTFVVEAADGGGSRVRMGRARRGGGVAPSAAAVAASLARLLPPDPYAEAQQQNRELLATLAALQQAHERACAANEELAATNRGVVALVAELDERAESLRRAHAAKSRFLAQASHEFRTPVNAILGLCGLLEARLDGPLTAEQGRQMGLVRGTAEGLARLIDDLLDLARGAAGKQPTRLAPFAVAPLLGGLRGIMRPLLAGRPELALEFVPPAAAWTMHSDEMKVAQILRNFIANAIKFTARGRIEVGVEARGEAAEVLHFWVRDSGIGIAAADQARIFEEFVQLASERQLLAPGSGLGLPLARQLAQLLGGDVRVTSSPGAGACFTATLPREVRPGLLPRAADETTALDPARRPVLLLGGALEDRCRCAAALEKGELELVVAADADAAAAWLQRLRPAAAILGDSLPGAPGRRLREALRASASAPAVPLLSLGAATADGAPGDVVLAAPLQAAALRAALATEAPAPGAAAPGQAVLVVDDDPTARYTLVRLLRQGAYAVAEAADAEAGWHLAQRLRPRCIVLDLQLPGESGEHLLGRLKADAALGAIPVVICSSRPLPPTGPLPGAAAQVCKQALMGEHGLLAALRATLPEAARDA